MACSSRQWIQSSLLLLHQGSMPCLPSWWKSWLWPSFPWSPCTSRTSFPITRPSTKPIPADGKQQLLQQAYLHYNSTVHRLTCSLDFPGHTVSFDAHTAKGTASSSSGDPHSPPCEHKRRHWVITNVDIPAPVIMAATGIAFFGPHDAPLCVAMNSFTATATNMTSGLAGLSTTVHPSFIIRTMATCQGAPPFFNSAIGPPFASSAMT